MTFKQSKQFWQFALRKSCWRLLLGLAAALALVLIVWIGGTAWWESWEAVITFLTLAVALAIGYQQMREEWEEDHLPKRLTTHYYHDGKEVMRCEKARLGGEADIRALTQQIGLQMTDVKGQLKFAAPDIEVSVPEVNEDGNYVHYVAKIRLIELPLTLSPGKRRVWREPFIQKGTYSFRDEDVETR
jgi:hypothetical protein